MTIQACQKEKPAHNVSIQAISIEPHTSIHPSAEKTQCLPSLPFVIALIACERSFSEFVSHFFNNKDNFACAAPSVAKISFSLGKCHNEFFALQNIL